MVQQEKGFTLVEVIVALAILAMALVAIIPLFLHSMRSTMVAGERVEVLYSVKEDMERSIATVAEGAPEAEATITVGSDVVKINGWPVHHGRPVAEKAVYLETWVAK